MVAAQRIVARHWPRYRLSVVLASHAYAAQDIKIRSARSKFRIPEVRGSPWSALKRVDSENLTNETVRDRICKLVLFNNRKSHTGFRLVPKVMTLNDLEPRNGCYFA